MDKQETYFFLMHEYCSVFYVHSRLFCLQINLALWIFEAKWLISQPKSYARQYSKISDTAADIGIF